MQRQKIQIHNKEIGQYWIAPNGQCARIGLRRTMSYYVDCFSHNSEMELSTDDVFAGISLEFPTYPKIKTIPSLHVDIVENKFFNMSPAKCISRFLSLLQPETIMKNDDAMVFRHFRTNPNVCRMCQFSYKIAKRHVLLLRKCGTWWACLRLLSGLPAVVA